MRARRAAAVLIVFLLMSAAAMARLPTAAAAAEEMKTRTVWKWVDENGVTHYSDTEVAGAERLEISVGGGLVQRQPAAAPADGGESGAKRPEPAPVTGYDTFDIMSPAENASVVNTEGRVEITLRLIPPLADDHKIEIHLDGKQVSHAGSYPATVLTRIARGTHRLYVVVLDAQGQTLIRSRDRIFHVKQMTAYSPQYPGRPEPPPPPPPWPPGQPQPTPPPP